VAVFVVIVLLLAALHWIGGIFDEPCDEMLDRSAVGLVVEHRVRPFVPGVGAVPGVLPGLGFGMHPQPMSYCTTDYREHTR
jgi:hypothetical protein